MRCPSKLDHESGVVLQCQSDRGHDGDHAAGEVRWTDADDRLLQGGSACCEGEPFRGDPVGFHTHDCPAYNAWADAYVRQQRERYRTSAPNRSAVPAVPLLPEMPEPFQRVEAAIAAQRSDPMVGDSPADAAVLTVLLIARHELAKGRPEWAEAFDALAEHLGYC